ncbi:MAG: flippase-like domain-containing protein [Thermoplasmata archaeon]|nr:MAG: flippase-like domain-containing protein [Thermoplasmata archaeon]
MLKPNRKFVIESLFSSIGIILFVYLIWSVKPGSIIEAVSHIDPFYFSISLLLIPVIMVVDTYRWRFLAKDQEVDLKFIEMIKIYTMGFFLSSITPGGIGGYLRAKLLHDKGKSLGRSISNVVIDISMKTFSLHIISVFILVFFFTDKLSLLFGVLFLIVSSIFPVMVIYRGEKVSSRLIRRLFLLYVSPEYRDTVIEGVNKIFDRPPRVSSLIKSVLVTDMCFVPLAALQIYTISLSLGISIPFLDLSAIWIVSLSISCLPVSISGLGVREWSMAYLSSKYMIDKSTAITLSLLGYTVLFFIPAAIGALFFIQHTTSGLWKVKK